jgi:hypothetical protein
MKYLSIFILLIFTPISAYCNWTGPTVIIKENWGLEDNELGMEVHESSWDYPSSYCASSNRFILADSINNRIKIYDLNGTYINAIDYDNSVEDPMSYRPWPDEIGCMSDRIYVEYGELRQLYNYEGDFVKDLPPISNVSRIQDDKLYTSDEINTYVYDKDGNLQKKINKPNNFFWVPIRSFDYGYLIGLDNINIKVIDKKKRPVNMYAFGNYLAAIYSNREDNFGFRICAVDKYGRCTATATTPLDDPSIAVSSTPIVAENGNIYMSIASADSMQILKWEWKDQVDPPYVPDPPKDPSVRPMLGWLLLDWTKAVQDGGCLTGYEISRSSSVNGTYEVIATLPKGSMEYKDAATEIGKTYYYKLRSIVNNLYSPYTEPVSGTRK